MAVSNAQKKATAKYENRKYDRILVRFPKGTKERIQKAGASSINSYIIRCVLNSLDQKEEPKKQKKQSHAPTLEEIQALLDEKRNERRSMQGAQEIQEIENI